MKDIDNIKLLAHYGALSHSFYKYMFTSIIPDNATFSNDEVQKRLLNALAGEKFIKDNGITKLWSNGVTIRYHIENDKVKMLQIHINGETFDIRLELE